MTDVVPGSASLGSRARAASFELVPVSNADIDALATMSIGRVTQFNARYGGLPVSQNLVGEDLLAGPKPAWSVVDADGRTVCVIQGVELRPFDFAAALRCYPVVSAANAAWELAQRFAAWFTDVVPTLLGVRRVVVRACSNTCDSLLIEALHQHLEIEGVLGGFWPVGADRYSEIFMSCPAIAGNVGQRTHAGAIFGPIQADPQPPPWERWAASAFEAKLEGRFTRLRPIRETDLRTLYEIETGGAQHGWLFRGTQPTFSAFAHRLDNDVTLQYAIERDSGAVCGRVLLHAVPSTFHLGSVSMVVHEELWQRGWPLEALVNFLRVCFDSYPLERVHFETSGAVPPSALGALSRTLRLEVELRGDRLVRGRPVDRLIYVLTREEAKVLEAKLRVARTG